METNVKNIETKTTELRMIQESSKKIQRKTSVTYTLQRMKTVLLSLSSAKMITEEEKQTLAKIYNDINRREIGEELKL